MVKRVHVVSDWGDGRLCAYLYGFAIDFAELQPEHKDFLSNTVGDVLVRWVTRGAKPQDFCQFWLHGTTSRSAPVSHNSGLSSERSRSVRKYLESELGRGHVRVPYNVTTTGLSETLALLSGKRDGSEDALDRSVILVAEWHSVANPKPPIIRRPSPKMLPHVYKNFLIRAVWAEGNALPIDRKGRVSAQNVVMDVEIMDVLRGETAIYTFDGTGPAVNFTPERMQDSSRGMAGKTGKWHAFWVLSGGAFKERNCDDFAGPAFFEEYSLATASWAAFYFEQVRDQPFKYAVGIRDFDTGVPAELVVVSGGGAVGKMKLKHGRQPAKKTGN